MEPFRYCDQSDVPYFVLEDWERKFPHLVVGFSARKYGEDYNCRNYAFHVGDDTDRVIKNRKTLSEIVGIPFSSWTAGEQVHGVHVKIVEKEDSGRGKDSLEDAFKKTDGLITQVPNILLTSYYADCVPLYFYCSYLDAVAVAHAGWKGTVGKIGPMVVEKLLQLGSKLEYIHVAIGPSIGPCCYEVDQKVITPLKQALEQQSLLEKVAVSHVPEKWQLDLKRANYELLVKAGIQPENILVSKWCTSCQDEYFYSYRRDHGKTGRMVAWIGKKGDKDDT